MKILKEIITKLEFFSFTPSTWLFSFLSIVAVRMILETFSANYREIYPLTSYPHIILFFAAILFSLILLLYFFTKKNIIKIAKVALVGWLVSWVPPVIDLIVSNGRDDLHISYLFIAPSDFFSHLITFFGPTLESGMTYGVRVQTILACLFVAMYVYYSTGKLYKTIFAPILTYFVIFIYSILPTLLATASNLSINISSADLTDFLFLPRDILGLTFTNPLDLFNFNMVLILFPILLIELLIFYYLYSNNKFFALLKNLRFTRFIFSLITLGAGFIIGFEALQVKPDFTFTSCLIYINAFLITILVWVVTTSQNDLSDVAIDQVSHSNRPLPQKIITPSESRYIILIITTIIILAALNLSFNYLTIILTLLALSWVYSAKPFYFKRYLGLSTFIMSASVLLSMFSCFILLSPDNNLKQFPNELILLILIFFTLVFNLKDIKDYAGDKLGNIYTLPTLLGQKRGQQAIAIIAALSFIVFSLFFDSSLLFIFSALFAVAAYILVSAKNYEEKYVFALYILYFVLFGIIIY